MINFLDALSFIVLSYFVVAMGMLYAFCPINDRETSATHKATTGVVTVGLLAWLAWAMFK